MIQPIADALKMLTKEDTRPKGADALSYVLAPIMAVFSVLMAWAVIPFTEKWIGADLSVGSLVHCGSRVLQYRGRDDGRLVFQQQILADRALSAVLPTLISYEVPLFLSLLVPVFLARSMGMNSIVNAQGAENGGVWFILMAPLAAGDLLRQLAGRGWPGTLRPARSRIRAGGRLSCGIFRDEVRSLPGRRVPAFVHLCGPDGDPVLRRLAWSWG